MRVKGRNRHLLVDILGLPIANRVEPANMLDRRTGSRLLAGLAPLWPTIRTVIADAGHESDKLTRQLRRDGWSLLIVKRKQQAFKVVSPGLLNAALNGSASTAVSRKATSAMSRHQKQCWTSQQFARC
jgi:transposase